MDQGLSPSSTPLSTLSAAPRVVPSRKTRDSAWQTKPTLECGALPGFDPWPRINALLTLPPPRNVWLMMRHGFSIGNAREWTYTSRRAWFREGLYPGERPELIQAAQAIRKRCDRFLQERGVLPRLVVIEGLFLRQRESTDVLQHAGLEFDDRVPTSALRERYFGDLPMPRLNRIFSEHLIDADKGNPFEKHFGFEAVAGVVGRLTRIIARHEKNPAWSNCIFVLASSHDAIQIGHAAARQAALCSERSPGFPSDFRPGHSPDRADGDPSTTLIPHPGWYTDLPAVKNGELIELRWGRKST